ncbi:MAG TPA: cytochrome c oxidase subunit II [Methylophilaceae bacterium]
MLGLSSVAANAAYQLNLQTPNSTIATQIYDLHMLILWVCVVIFVVVFGALFYSLLKHRKSVGHKAAHFHESTAVEIAWTVIPFLILIVMAFPATKTMIQMRDTPNPDMTIKVTAYQWKWEYDYQKDGVKYMSVLSTPQDQIDNKAPKDEHYLLEVDNPMVVPVGKKVRLLLAANDVIHSWSMPAFGVKQDAIPGFIKDTWFRADRVGTYRGQCSELCGKGHGFMPIVVEVKEQADYDKWFEEQKTKAAAANADAGKEYTADELKAKGEAVFTANCAACHQANGKGIPGTIPALDGSKIATGPKDAHINRVMNGKPGTAMAAFAPQLSDLDIAAVITYERNSWSNHDGDFVKPSEIKALRK